MVHVGPCVLTLYLLEFRKIFVFYLNQNKQLIDHWLFNCPWSWCYLFSLHYSLNFVMLFDVVLIYKHRISSSSDSPIFAKGDQRGSVLYGLDIQA